jgi:UDP-glucuronate decarboxylase
MGTGDEFTGPVNIGNPSEISILAFAQIVIELTDSKSKLVFKPLPQDDPKQRQPDIDLAESQLDWYPRVDLINGLKKTIAYFKI